MSHVAIGSILLHEYFLCDYNHFIFRSVISVLEACIFSVYLHDLSLTEVFFTNGYITYILYVIFIILHILKNIVRNDIAIEFRE